MKTDVQRNEAAGARPAAGGGFLARTRKALGWATLGLLAGVWIGGGTDRYGEDDGVVGGLRGACRTFCHGYRYTAATARQLAAGGPSPVRNLGLGRQVENRLWQDKRLAAEAIVVEVEDGGKVVLMGQVPEESHKRIAVELATDTRGVESVVDQVAVAAPPRVIDAPTAPAVPTGVATGLKPLPVAEGLPGE